MRILIAVLSLTLFVNSSYAQEAEREAIIAEQSVSEKEMSKAAPKDKGSKSVVKRRMHKSGVILCEKDNKKCRIKTVSEHKSDRSKQAKLKIGHKDPTVCKKNDKACLAKAAATSDKDKIEIADKEGTSTDKAKADFSKDKASEFDNILVGEDRY